MRREYFGWIGELLPDRDLARVLVIAAEAPGLLRAFLRRRATASEFGDALGDLGVERSREAWSSSAPLRVDLRSVRRILAHERPDADTLDALWSNLASFWACLSDARPGPYELILQHAGGHLDRQWLAQVLTCEERIGSVLFDSRRPRAAGWTWPLKIGLPDTDAGRALREGLLDADERELFTPIIAGHESSFFELLLVPDTLSGMAGPPWPGWSATGAVIVLGGAELGAAQTVRRVSTLMTRWRSGLGGVCFVPREQHVSWVLAVIRELSHDRSLPAAMFKARLQQSRHPGAVPNAAEDLWAPLVLGDERFVRSTHISAAAARFAAALRRDRNAAVEVVGLPDLVPGLGLEGTVKTAEELGDILEKGLEYVDWTGEGGDATAFVRLQQELEAQLGAVAQDARRAIDMPAFEVAAAAAAAVDVGASLPLGRYGQDLQVLLPPSPAPGEVDAAEEDRHVQAALFPLGWHDAAAPATSLVSGQKYRLRVHIGPLQGGDVIAADVALDETALPANEDGHELKIVYCPLSRVVDADGREAIPPPLQAWIRLPRRGASSHAEFLLQCGAEALEFRARLIVTHGNRVLQTLLISAEGEDAHVVIGQENIFTPGYVSRDRGPPADIAFVVNDNPGGASGITTLVSDSASFVEPAGLKTAIQTIETLLSDANAKAVGERKPALDRKRIVRLLVQLAHHGASIVFELRQNHPLARFESAERIQVVEAIEKAYLPVEFFYSGKAPDPKLAKLCPHAVDALRDPKREVHAKCPHRDNDGYVCPVAFWGFQKCIERYPSAGAVGHVLAVPTAETDRLDPIDCALLAASDRAKREMTGPKGLPSMLSDLVPKVERASSWKEWKDMVGRLSPGLLLLLPHSGESPDVLNMPALEISATWLESSRVGPDYVRPSADEAAGPLVLLLGCSTALADIDFLNFVRKFYRCGAPMVLGTLAAIHSTQASLVACRLLGELKGRSGTQARFDEVLLKVKCELLAQGHDVALGLVAYGHGAWLI